MSTPLYFFKLLSESDKVTPDICSVADFLRSTTSTLAELGITIQDRYTKEHSLQWRQLRRCLTAGTADDALVVFQAMVRRLADCSMPDRAPVMLDAFQRPWRLRAIEAEPDFFRTTKPEELDRRYAFERHSVDAFQVLAYAGRIDVFAKEDILSSIHALKAIGVSMHVNPMDRTNCIHPAAAYHGSEVLGVFVQEFPSALERADIDGCRTLHFAAKASDPENLKVLLGAGVKPRPVSRVLGTPMAVAAKRNNIDGVTILLETGAYTDDDLNAAMSQMENAIDLNAAKLQRLRPYHAAVKARQAIGQLPGDNDRLPQPL